MFLLCILDGYGLGEGNKYNAISTARTPNLGRLFKSCNHTTLDCSGLAVGLPEGQMGNSEVGHLNFGAGRVVYQEVTRIDKSISDGDFFTNEAFLKGIKEVSRNKSVLHLFGLLSDGCVHSSMEHIKALAKMAKDNGVTKLYLHAFMDGRDTPPHSGVRYMKDITKYFAELGLGRVATVMGRYYGMDRDNRWERNEKAYLAIVNKVGERFDDPVTAIEKSYKNDITDEFILPVCGNIDGSDEGKLSDGDVALIFNFRADRVRQLCHLFTGFQPDGFKFHTAPDIRLVTMTNYDKELKTAVVAFPSINLSNIFGELISGQGLKQLRIAETEKYPHVTYFFNGGIEEPFENEDRIMIPSPKVATYDLQPEMSSVAVTNEAVQSIKSKKYDVIVLNFANCDMVGHTGILEAAVKAVEAVDLGVGKVIDAVTDVGGAAIITADHGNAEQMYDPSTDGPHTAHTTNPVPFILYDSSGSKKNTQLRQGGILADVAPTILEYLGLKRPPEMTGQSMLVSSDVTAIKN